LGIKGTEQKNWGSREHELKKFLGTRGFINGEQGIKSKKIKGSWEHVPPWEGLTDHGIYLTSIIYYVLTHCFEDQEQIISCYFRLCNI